MKNQLLKTVEKIVTLNSTVRRLSECIVSSIVNVFNASVAQLDRASDFESEGWGFKSLRVYKYHRSRRIPKIYERDSESGNSSEKAFAGRNGSWGFPACPTENKSCHVGQSGGKSLLVNKVFTNYRRKAIICSKNVVLIQLPTQQSFRKLPK